MELKLGRFANIDVKLHTSWFIIFALMTWSLAVGFFPEEYPALSPQAYWGMAAVTSLLFFGSVLAHEYGHALMALRESIPVRGITLFIFGGVAELGRESRTAGAEFRIAMAGPLVSFALALFFGILWLLDHTISPYLAAPSLWLARINLTLGLFNLIPGYPLDGGRVLRAVVWKITGDPYRSLRWASILGQVTAFGFIGWGIFTALTGSLFGGIWFAAIGWFLQNAAAAGLAQSNLQYLLKDVPVANIMSANYYCVSAETTLKTLVDQVLAGGPRAYFVTHQGRLRGLVTLTDISRIPTSKWDQTTAQEVMVPWEKVVQVSPTMPLLEALYRMEEARVSQLPVVKDLEMVGVLSRERVLRQIHLRSELSG